MDEQGHVEDEQLYALLDTAFSEDALTVSEELIQKTLQRVKEEKLKTPAGRTVSLKKWLSYGGMAAAAVAVLVLGGNTLGKKTSGASDMLQKGEVRMRSEEPVHNGDNTPNAGYFAEEYVTDNAVKPEGNATWEHGSDGIVGHDLKAAAQELLESWQAEYERLETAYELSEAVCSVLSMAGYHPLNQKASVWKKCGSAVQTEIDWNEELSDYFEEKGTAALKTEERLETMFPDETHFLLSTKTGAEEMLLLETDQGRIWVLFDEEILILK